MLNTYKENSGQIQLASGSPLIGRSGRSYCSAASCPARRNVKFLLPSDNKEGGGDQNQLNYGRQTGSKLLRVSRRYTASCLYSGDRDRTGGYTSPAGMGLDDE